jgi:hypothetical protein
MRHLGASPQWIELAHRFYDGLVLTYTCNHAASEPRQLFGTSIQQGCCLSVLALNCLQSIRAALLAKTGASPTIYLDDVTLQARQVETVASALEASAAFDALTNGKLNVKKSRFCASQPG